ARDGAVGVIDRSQDARHSAGPNGLQKPLACLDLASRNPSWQRSCAAATTDRTYDRKRSDAPPAETLQAGGRPHMGPRLCGDDVATVASGSKPTLDRIAPLQSGISVRPKTGKAAVEAAMP